MLFKMGIMPFSVLQIMPPIEGEIMPNYAPIAKKCRIVLEVFGALFRYYAEIF